MTLAVKINKQKSRVRKIQPTTINRVAIVYSSPGFLNTYWQDSIDRLRGYDTKNKRRLMGTVSGMTGANISRQRNKNIHTFFEHYGEADWVLLLDTDMVFEPDLIDRLIASADPVHRPIMGGLCFGYDQETRQIYPTLYVQDQQGAMIRLAEYPKNEVCKVSATGTACLLVHRSVFEEIQEAEPENDFAWFYEINDGKNWWGEDIIFCLRAGSLDIPVHVDTSIKVGHRKEIEINEELFERQVTPARVAAIQEKLAGIVTK